MASFTRRLTAEAIGSAFLLAAIVGAGVMADRLAGGNVALALLGDTLATAAMLTVLLFVAGPVSGAHLNPLVSIALAAQREFPASEMLAYICAQIGGAILGVWIAHAMFNLPILQLGNVERSGVGQWLGEAVATFGLLLTVFGCRNRAAFPFIVALYIAAAFWFTSSTSFANPAVTIARSLSGTFAGISPVDAPMFLIAQAIGALAAVGLSAWMFDDRRANA